MPCHAPRSSSMWIVRLALRRPYTFAVLALLIGIMGAITVARTPNRLDPAGLG